MFNVVSFFLLNDWLILLNDIFYYLCVKKYVSYWFHLFIIQAFHIIAVVFVHAVWWWSFLYENQLTILIRNANYQVRNALCDDQRINDLCRRFRYFISDSTRGENACIVCTHLSLLYTLAVMLHSMCMIFTFMIIYRSDSGHCSFCIWFDQNPNNSPMLLSLSKFMW